MQQLLRSAPPYKTFLQELLAHVLGFKVTTIPKG
jgi:hypothetical protein